MRSNVLLFLHVLLGMAVLGAALTAAVSALAAARRDAATGRVLRTVSWQSALLSLVAAVAALGLGEALASKEDAEGTWLDVGRGLTMGVLVLVGLIAVVVARLALRRDRLVRATGILSLVIAVASLAVVFVMAGKPG